MARNSRSSAAAASSRFLSSAADRRSSLAREGDAHGGVRLKQQHAPVRHQVEVDAEQLQWDRRTQFGEAFHRCRT
jgi:hypothetical protein